jgi:hypothetical protein
VRRAGHPSRGVLPTVVRRCVLSRNLKNEEAIALGSQRHKKKIYIRKFQDCCLSQVKVYFNAIVVFRGPR